MNSRQGPGGGMRHDATPLSPPQRRWLVVLWPAFMAAALLELLVFAVVDPQALHAPGGGELPLSRTAIYSLAFVLFWACTTGAAAAALWLAQGAPGRTPPAG